LGWISFALFAVAQYRTIQNIISLASENCAIWILPIKPDDYSEAVLNQGWSCVSANFRIGTLARWEGVLPEYTASIAGMTRGESRYVTFTLMHRLGVIHDAFSDTFVTDSRFTSLLSSPPLLIAGEAWSEEYIAKTDE